MQTRRKSPSTINTESEFSIAEGAIEGSAPKANLTTAQMRAAGKIVRLTLEPLRNNVFLISGSGGNVIVLPGSDAKLVIDSGLATSQLQMTEALQSISQDPLRYLINTHWHFDHTDGNAWMHASGATIYAHERTLARMQQRQVIPEFDGIYPPSAAGALPSITFQATKSLSVNGREVTLSRYTPAHTDSDIAVFLPDADILHAGDTFFSSFYPFIDYNSGGNIDGLIAACRETLALTGSSTIIVGGHGRPGRRDDLIAFEQMMTEVRGRVATLKQQGALEREVVARKPSAPFDALWGNGFVSPELFISLVYRGVGGP